MLQSFTFVATMLPALAVSLAAAAQSTTERSDDWHRYWEWGWGHMAFGSLMMVLFWGLIIVSIVVAIRWLGGGRSGGLREMSSRNSALEILEQRFARGEIDKEEFEERKKVLSG